MKFKIKIGEKEIDIEILETESGTKIKVGEKEFLFQKEEKEKTSSQVSIPKKDFSRKEILAPISGQILEIFFKEGDFVKKGKTLLILSAMKMENEILAEKEGKITKIFVKKGENVKKGQKLMEIL